MRQSIVELVRNVNVTPRKQLRIKQQLFFVANNEFLFREKSFYPETDFVFFSWPDVYQHVLCVNDENTAVCLESKGTPRQTETFQRNNSQVHLLKAMGVYRFNTFTTPF